MIGNGTMIDVTMPIQPDMRLYPGMARPVVERVKEHSVHGIQVTRLTLTVHSGTHVDAPRHLLNGGDTIDLLDPSLLMGEAVLLDLTAHPPGTVITEAELKEAGSDLAEGDIAVLRTGYQTFPEIEQYCWLEPKGAEWLVEKKVKCFAGDIPSVDPINRTGSVSFATHPSHHILLRAGIPIVESLFHLEQLKSKQFFFCCLPLNIVGSDGAPARALVMEPA